MAPRSAPTKTKAERSAWYSPKVLDIAIGHIARHSFSSDTPHTAHDAPILILRPLLELFLHPGALVGILQECLDGPLRLFVLSRALESLESAEVASACVLDRGDRQTGEFVLVCESPVGLWEGLFVEFGYRCCHCCDVRRWMNEEKEERRGRERKKRGEETEKGLREGEGDRGDSTILICG